VTFHTNFIHNQVTVPALASVYNEKALKSQFDTSIYLQVCIHFDGFLLWHSILSYFANAYDVLKLPFDCDFSMFSELISVWLWCNIQFSWACNHCYHPR
jgi:hypothetical protein